MTCCVLVLTEQGVVALHEGSWVRPCPDWLLLSPGEREKKNFLSLFPDSFSSLPVSQLYMFNELASLSVYISLLHSITFPPCLHTLFLLYPMFFLSAFTKLQQGLRNTTILCRKDTFSIIAHIICVKQSLSHIPRA